MKILDPSKNYLLSRPQGGFTDKMAQIEKSRLYAARYGRCLIMDTTTAGLREPFDALFEPTADFGCEVIVWTPEIGRELDTIENVLPRDLKNRVSTYETTWVTKAKCCCDIQTGCATLFDFSKDHDEQLLIYDQAGGGIAAIHALSHLVLRAEIADQIAERLIALGSEYDAVHIRHTDYKTNYRKFLRRLRPRLKGRSVLVCTDSFDVTQATRRILCPSTTILSNANVPDMDGKPLHTAEGLDNRALNLDMISDLLALGCAETLYFTGLAGRYSNRADLSGFSLFADLLWRNPDVIRSFLSQADPVLLSQLAFGTNRVAVQPRNLWRKALLLDEWRWNYRAKAKAKRRNTGALEKEIRPEDIYPKFKKS